MRLSHVMSPLMKNVANNINQAYLANQSEMIDHILLYLEDYDTETIQRLATDLVTEIRQNKANNSLVNAFLHEYQLNSEEGIILMGIAEALLRIPDPPTQDLFLQEKLSQADWDKHALHSDSIWVNFSTLALDITAKIENPLQHDIAENRSLLLQLSSHLCQPLIRTALKQAMQQLASQFVIAESIENALAKAKLQPDYQYSFDMLGEAALTASDAERYFISYKQAIQRLAAHADNKSPHHNPSISIKLSALCPRYQPLQHKYAVPQISKKLLYLAQKACAANINITIDAEESERLEMSLQIFKRVLTDESLKYWSGLGLAVQAYQKRALSTLHWLSELAKKQHCQIPIRLVKGAYWDSEIKRAQVNGLSDYPVFTHKTATDACYLACSKFILSQPKAFYPQFATHNAQTVATILTLAKGHPAYEFQRLHGMGELLYQSVLKQTNHTIPCRIYAPVGNYQELLPYLVRRLLENGANSSFINQLENTETSVEKVTTDPIMALTKPNALDKSFILPKDLYGRQRINSKGTNLADLYVLNQLSEQLQQIKTNVWQAAPLINGKIYAGIKHHIINPACTADIVGSVIYAEQQSIEKALDVASAAFNSWRLCPVKKRVLYLQKTADLLEQNQLDLVSLCVREAGKTIADAIAEIREAVDFCRYYAQLASEQFEQPISLPGPTGETNQLYHYGRGVFVCISPWNFPIAIFIGQITAALVCGNTVIAKAATQTPLTAMYCIKLMQQAGIPKEVLNFLPGDGASIAKHLLSDPRIAGVAFTGSLATARLINQQIAQHPDIIPLIAETGGQNVMIADTSAYSEQLIKDVVQSAFNSAGQRCSALRVLYLPQAIAEQSIDRIIGVMQQLVINNPQDYAVDSGPVISHNAVKQLSVHVANIKKQAKVLFQYKLNDPLQSPCFFPPTLIELTSLSQLTEENFGPILHIIRYAPAELNQIIEDINSSGYGLTLGIHSRISKTADSIAKNSKVGNVYVNRNMIGAVVGSQPFGGMGLSGTGPKAGGPHYLHRFCNEQTVSINTAAIGGNAQLMTDKPV